jgi:3-oxoacyl-[acyl-carrier-protein] synthase II
MSYYKHLTGEFPTSSVLALWIASKILNSSELNPLMQINTNKPLKNILLYNTYKGHQHSFILVSAV